MVHLGTVSLRCIVPPVEVITMNMQQRKYIVKKRIEPMKRIVSQAMRAYHYEFVKYMCWGDLVKHIKDGTIKLDRTYYHKSCHVGYIHARSSNPFGSEAAALLGKEGGVRVNEEKQTQSKHDWAKRFQHAEDFIMLASEETGIKLLHDLERMVEEFKLKASKQYDIACKKQAEYTKWLETQGERHDYHEPSKY